MAVSRAVRSWVCAADDPVCALGARPWHGPAALHAGAVCQPNQLVLRHRSRDHGGGGDHDGAGRAGPRPAMVAADRAYGGGRCLRRAAVAPVLAGACASRDRRALAVRVEKAGAVHDDDQQGSGDEADDRPCPAWKCRAGTGAWEGSGCHAGIIRPACTIFRGGTGVDCLLYQSGEGAPHPQKQDVGHPRARTLLFRADGWLWRANG